MEAPIRRRRVVPVVTEAAALTPAPTPPVPVHKVHVYRPDPPEDLVAQARAQDEAERDRTDYAAIIQGYKDKIHNPMTAIRSHCVECSAGQIGEVRQCPRTKCSLWPLRMGTNVFHGRTGRANPNAFGRSTDEQGDGNG
jgi:hypothetical protein